MTTVLLPRPAGADADAALLERSGITPVSDPYVEIIPLLDPASMAARLRLAERLPASALVITSARALRALVDHAEVDRTTRVFAVGPASAQACRDAGFLDVRVPEDGADNVALTRLLARERPDSIVIPRSSAAPSSLVDDLRALGITVHDAVLYATTTIGHRPETLRGLIAGDFDAVIVRSGSAARALAHYVQEWPALTRVIAAGRSTALVLREVGIPVSAIAAQPDSASVVATTLRTIGGSPA